MTDLNKKISELERELDSLRKAQEEQKYIELERRKKEQEDRIKALVDHAKSVYGNRLSINSVGYLSIRGKLDGKLVTIYDNSYDNSFDPDSRYYIRYERSGLQCSGPSLDRLSIPSFNPLNMIQIGDTFVISEDGKLDEIEIVRSLEYSCNMSFGDNRDACYEMVLEAASSIRHEVLINGTYRLPLYNRDLDQLTVTLTSYNDFDEIETKLFLFGDKAEEFINKADLV